MRGSELIAAFLEHSKFVVHLGMKLREIEDDRAVLVLPFSEERRGRWDPGRQRPRPLQLG
jgi:acyl-coenzyme A thioesterase PaaI-like protein